jgi:hypothetical protein
LVALAPPHLLQALVIARARGTTVEDAFGNGSINSKEER